MMYAGSGGGVQQIAETEEARPIARSMSELAATIGDLETAVRAVLSRVAPLIPGGSPFDRAEKLAAMQNGSALNTPAAVRSHFCEQIDTRTYQLREITTRLNEAFKGIEL